jgi:pimeloyl-ACP methyl ester carboxylesterase
MRRIAAILLLALAAACSIGTAADDNERFPVSSSYPPGTMQRISFTAAAPEAWRLSALTTPERPEASWKIVIITGTPSWSEYWAPTIAGLPATRELIVADRPGFAQSQPETAVRDIALQAEALSPMLEAKPGQRVLVVGQSFGAPVAILMAARNPEKVDALVLLSSYFGERGPTARRLFGVGRVVQGLLPRDLRNSITEVRAQGPQLPAVWQAFEGLAQPVIFVHGDRDSFVTLQSAEHAAARHANTLITIEGGDHFLNACCVPALLDAFETAIAEVEARDAPVEEAQLTSAPARN